MLKEGAGVETANEGIFLIIQQQIIFNNWTCEASYLLTKITCRLDKKLMSVQRISYVFEHNQPNWHWQVPKNFLHPHTGQNNSTISSMSSKTGKRIELILLITISRTKLTSTKRQPSSKQEIEIKKKCPTKYVEQIFRTRA